MFKHRVFYVGGQRSHLRINCRIPVDYVVDQRVHHDFIENISQKSAYIGTKRPMTVGSKIVMTFLWLEGGGHPIKSKGEVVRATPNGFAVLFDQPIAIQQSA